MIINYNQILELTKTDESLMEIFMGKSVKVLYKNGQEYSGRVTRIISSPKHLFPSNPKSKTCSIPAVGIVLDAKKEIGFSLCQSIEIE